MTKINLEEMTNFCKQKGFVFQSGSIYGGLSGFFDFGHLGVMLKDKLKEFYKKEFVKKRNDMFMLDSSIITNPKTWESSGHTSNFSDPILTTKDSKTKIRADHFIEDELKISADGMSLNDINNLIKKNNLKHKGEDFLEGDDFNLMFSTNVGAKQEKSSTAYLRPETCQSIFTNFKLMCDTNRAKLPFGICQVGKTFRNEISPRDFIFRCREFEQIEMEYFFNPKTKFEIDDKIKNFKINFLSQENQEKNKIAEMEKINNLNCLEIHKYWIFKFLNFLLDLGIDKKNLRIREHLKKELSHYSSSTFDIEYNFPNGFKELIGIANRGNFDLTQHQKFSKSKLEFFDNNENEKILPNVIEPSLGVERLFFCVLYEAYKDDKERGNIILNLSKNITPYKIGIFPLMKKENLIKKAKEICKILDENNIDYYYDESGTIGKRYARSDEIGIPYCLCVDFESCDNNKFTIRDILSTKQEVIEINEIINFINRY